MSKPEDPKPVDFPEELSTRERQLDPFDWYREMRRGSLRYDEKRGCWDVFTYEGVKEILSNDGVFSSSLPGSAAPDAPEEQQEIFRNSMLFEDPPRHTRLRSAVEDSFAPDAILSLEPEIKDIARSLLEEAVGEETDTGTNAESREKGMDVVDALAYPLPVVVIAAVLGVPPDDRDEFKRWSDTVVSHPQMRGDEEPGTDLREEKRGASHELGNYLIQMMKERREEPKDDLISELVKDSELSDHEILTMSALLLVAGNVTTTNLITNAVRCFVEADAGTNLIGRLRGDEKSLETAVEEVLRYRSPVQRTSRLVTQDVEIEGREIQEGEVVTAWMGSAHRDPEVFENPDEFVPDRSPNPHLAFGRGIHFCIGAHLARLEAKVALSEALDRIEGVRLVETEYRPVSSSFLHGVQSLPIRYSVRS